MPAWRRNADHVRPEGDDGLAAGTAHARVDDAVAVLVPAKDDETWLMRGEQVITAYPSRLDDQKLTLRRGRGKGMAK